MWNDIRLTLFVFTLIGIVYVLPFIVSVCLFNLHWGAGVGISFISACGFEKYIDMKNTW